MKITSRQKLWGLVLLASVCLSSLGTLGCQVEVGGQTLPSPYYLTDDVQYFPRGHEFKLYNEAAAMKAYNEQVARQQQQQAR